MVYVFHHNDIDGHASAHLVKRFLNKEVSFISCDYSVSLLSLMDNVVPGDTVFLVDYSLKISTIDDFKVLIERVGVSGLVWIDYYQSSLDLITLFPELNMLEGLRKNGISAAALTWMYFNKVSFLDCPYFLQLISDYDTWIKSMKETDNFYFGILSADWSVESNIWAMLEVSSIVSLYVSKGKTIRNYI